MPFVIIARDGTDPAAPERRRNARPDHLRNMEENRAHMVMGVATLDSDDSMTGSVLIVDFPTREAVDLWLGTEPYVTQGVWKDITVLPCKIAPSFMPQS